MIFHRVYRYLSQSQDINIMKHTVRGQGSAFSNPTDCSLWKCLEISLEIWAYNWQARYSDATDEFWQNVLQTATKWSSYICFLGHSGVAQLWKSDNRMLISDKIRVIKLLFSSHNKTSQHILLKKKEMY